MRYEGKSLRRYSYLGLLACGVYCTHCMACSRQGKGREGKGREGKALPGQAASRSYGAVVSLLDRILRHYRHAGNDHV